MMSASAGAASYLDVRYAEEKKPFSNYPTQLCHYLTSRYLEHCRGGKLLDLGCGRGEFLHAFAEQEFEVLGLDRARPAVPRFPETVLDCDYERSGIPLPDRTLDVVFNKSVLEHTQDISGLLGEIYRVLKPGGRVISLVPDFSAQYLHFYDDWTHVRPFTLVGLRECLSCHGFELREAERFRQLPFLWQRPWLRPIASVAARLPNALKPHSKLVRFSKEWMLLAVADRPLD